MNAWTTAADIRARVRRRWDDDTLPRAWVTGAPCPVLEVPVRGPRAGEIGDDVVAVREWADALRRAGHDGAHFDLTTAAVGGRHIGRNEIPVRASVSRFEQAWALLGVQAEILSLRMMRHAAVSDAAALGWLTAHPRAALGVAAEWRSVLAARDWLDRHRGSGLFLRQVDAPGVDTKFIARHRSTLAAMLGVRPGSTTFVADLGLSGPPERIRFRADPELGLAPGFTDVTVPRHELGLVDRPVSTALVVENEVSFLIVPVPRGGVVLWGRGFEVDRAGALPWLRAAQVRYWGDLDTHGFAILDRLRAWLPQTTSVLMDRATLLDHRDRWGTEPTPTRARLARLTPDEAELYDDLVADRLGVRVRLEQERLDWQYVLARLGDV